MIIYAIIEYLGKGMDNKYPVDINFSPISNNKSSMDLNLCFPLFAKRFE